MITSRPSSSWMMSNSFSIMRDTKVGVIHEFFNCFELILEGREQRVALNGPFDQGQVKIRTERQSLRVDLGAAANEHIAAFRFRMKLGELRYGLDAGVRKARAGNDDSGAIGQGSTDGFEGLAAHDDDVAGGHLLEPLEILRQVPGDFVAVADDPVEGHGGDGLEVLHTAIGALMPGCGS